LSGQGPRKMPPSTQPSIPPAVPPGSGPPEMLPIQAAETPLVVFNDTCSQISLSTSGPGLGEAHHSNLVADDSREDMLTPIQMIVLHRTTPPAEWNPLTQAMAGEDNTNPIQPNPDERPLRQGCWRATTASYSQAEWRHAGNSKTHHCLSFCNIMVYILPVAVSEYIAYHTDHQR